jgi:hypothetical protein
LSGVHCNLMNFDGWFAMHAQHWRMLSCKANSPTG